MIIHRIAKQVQQKRVAPYARVSTLAEQQEESYETQINYYTQLIDQTEGWEMVRMYADPGITGTSAKKRPEFMQMIQDAKDGKIDLILCKSISRFSRNFAEAQQYVHELKSIHVEVWFEKEGVHTFDPNSDLLFSAMAAAAQEESRAISENVKWSYRKLAEQGIRHVGNNHVLGYDEVNGKLTPNKDAWIVKLMFEEYAKGKGPAEIARILEEKGAKRMRSSRRFSSSSILAVLKNEVYVGDRLLQKNPPQNYLTKRPDPTEAYDSKYLSGDHEAVVSHDVWDAVQKRLKKTEENREIGINHRSTAHFLYGRIFCPECGELYRRFTARNASGPYKTWRCRGRVNSNGCCSRHISEAELLDGITAALGWKELDESSFDATVDKVLIMPDGLQVVMKREEMSA